MRHLMLAATMLVVGLAFTLGAASICQDVAVAWSKSGRGDKLDITQAPMPATPAERPQDSHN
jgi:hypothetical protein